MIGTAQPLRALAVASRQRAGPVGADIEEALECAGLITQQDNRLSADLAHDVVAGAGEGAGRRHDLPGGGEHMGLVKAVASLAEIDIGAKRACVFQRGYRQIRV